MNMREILEILIVLHARTHSAVCPYGITHNLGEEVYEFTYEHQ